MFMQLIEETQAYWFNRGLKQYREKLGWWELGLIFRNENNARIRHEFTQQYKGWGQS